MSGEKLYCDSKITNCTILTSLRCQLSADFSLLDKPVICTPVATTQTATQFVLDVDCNGVAVRIMYDTGASISFSLKRPSAEIPTGSPRKVSHRPFGETQSEFRRLGAFVRFMVFKGSNLPNVLMY